ncbi:acyl-CoA/acyl-ACP dehydrogenase [Peribacillus frigoritolerans]|jgi:acyl-CoA dehydrogenase|uniref:acyl-CoA dehydrogenase family protein n=1 Tax=Peribacillus frigoritolerans TaxID=450367 RepID=UPI00227F2CF4|nr:acyl-CoA dehydrogenase family protein [Peribacillus frigoritolerans]MCY9002402.1 acyl-CoA/acyl-ACP dehydrogenase [Peribacillus frigoritolerans]MED4632264.1 acyl-CoA/acyl-ACP dehydrogenase [Peribacillus frigoritolerans]
MEFNMPEETQEIINGIKQFINKVVIPLEEENRDLLYNERKYYLEDGRRHPKVEELRRIVRKESAKAGFYTMFGAEELGGGGFGPLTALLVNEAIGKHYPHRKLIEHVVIPSPFTNGLTPVLNGLKQELKDKYIEGIGSGEKTLCFGLTEPDAGSDVWGIKTRAVKDGNEWVLNGTKQWISHAHYADYCMLFAVTNPELQAKRKGGITCFFVETKLEGFNVDSVIPVMGSLGGDATIISIDNLRIPEENIIGELDQGFGKAMNGINNGRLGMSGKCIGSAQWALQKAVEYSKIRKTFGKTLSEHQTIQNMLADCALDIYAARNMALNCAWKIENSTKTPTKEISMVKAFCTEMMGRVYDRAIQIHGGMGLSNELGLEEGYRNARLVRIPDGTSEIHRRTIARSLLKGDLSF